MISWGPLRQARDGLDDELPPGPLARDTAWGRLGPEVGLSVLGARVGQAEGERRLERNGFLPQAPGETFVSGARWGV